MSNADSFSSDLQELQRIFRAHLGKTLPEMRSAWRAFMDDPSLAHAKVFIGSVHRIAGTAGTIGFGGLGTRAAAIEVAVRSISEGGTIPEDVAQDVSGFFGMIVDLTASSGQSGEAQP